MRKIKVRSTRVITLSLLLGLSLVGLSLMLARPPVSRAATTRTVNSTADDGTGTCTVSKCTLRDAIANASATASPGDTINFSLPANSIINLTSGELSINKNLTINGPGANLLTLSGNNSVRVFNIGSAGQNISVTISGLTIAKGNASDVGGGIVNKSVGILTITGCAISNNTAGSGGGIYKSNGGTVTITNSTISGNTASNGGGGGIYNINGTVTITNSTISGNTAS